MSEKFNPYEPSITATKKTIDTRQAKLNELKDLENKAFDGEYRRELMMDIGRTEADAEFSTGAKKRAAESRLNENGTRKALDKICDKCAQMGSTELHTLLMLQLKLMFLLEIMIGWLG